MIDLMGLRKRSRRPACVGVMAAVVVALAALLMSAGALAAHPRPKTVFKGRTSQRLPVTLRVPRTGAQTYWRVVVQPKCAGGDVELKRGKHATAPIHRDGTFRSAGRGGGKATILRKHGTEKGTVRWTFLTKGHFASRGLAAGTYSFVDKYYNARGELFTTCKAKVTWTAAARH